MPALRAKIAELEAVAEKQWLVKFKARLNHL